MTRAPLSSIVFLAAATLGALAACPEDGAKNPPRLWLDAQQEGGTATLEPVEPAPY